MNPFLRSALIGPDVHCARAASSFGESGRGLDARIFKTSACLAGSSSWLNPAANSGATVSSVTSRVPAWNRTPAGTTASSTCAPGAQIVFGHPLA